MSQFQHTSKALKKVNSRKAEYQKTHAPDGKDYHFAKTRKNAYAIVTGTSESNGSATLPAKANTYDDLYSNKEGKPDVLLNQVSVKEGSDFGMLREVNVSFTCMSRAAFETYEKVFLRPGSKLDIKFGYVDGTDSDHLKDFVLCKYDFSLDDKNRYKCNFKGYGPGPFINQVEIDGQGDFKDMEFSWMGFWKTPVVTLPQYLKYIAQGKGLADTVDIDNWTVRNDDNLKGLPIVVIDNPNGRTPDTWVGRQIYKVLQAIGFYSSDSSKVIYCTLEWLVAAIQHFLIRPNLGKEMKGRKLVCNTEVSSGAHPIGEIGSAYPMSIVLPGGSVGSMGGPGYYGSSPQIPIGDEGKLDFTSKAGEWSGTCIQGEEADYSKILISYDYISSNMFGKSADAANTAEAVGQAIKTKGKKKRKGPNVNAMFGKLFGDIYQATGGCVSLALMEDPKDPKNLNVVAKNGKPEPITETVFDPIKGDGVTRKCTIKCDVPADDAYAVANGAAAGGSGHTSSLIAQDPPDEDEKIDPVQEAKDNIKKMMETGLSSQDFANEDCDALASAFKTLKEKADAETTSKLELDGHIWPLELELELDGMSGFRFGDVINTKFLPPAYTSNSAGGVKPSFVTLEATHTISGNDWSTKLKSQCHLLEA